jgi:hypothetical protein
MFEAKGFELQDDHLDLSYSATSGWPDLGPARSLWVSLGDPVSGPALQLGETDPLSGEMVWLPPHYHGSDQVRAMIRGEFVISNKHLQPGDFVFQEAGRRYREGGSAATPEPVWILGIMGARRGAPSTFTASMETEFPLDAIGEEQLDLPRSPEDPRWADVPGGSEGISMIATTFGGCKRGHLWGAFPDMQEPHNGIAWREGNESSRIAAALIGDMDSGPVLCFVEGLPDLVAIPGDEWKTEVVVVIVRGSCHIGSDVYSAGDIRVQRSGSEMADVVAGESGVSVLFIIADRRAVASKQVGESMDSKWKKTLESITSELGSLIA